VLVSSALHSGSITAAHLRNFEGRGKRTPL
jgi:hypothetical protein